MQSFTRTVCFFICCSAKCYFSNHRIFGGIIFVINSYDIATHVFFYNNASNIIFWRVITNFLRNLFKPQRRFRNKLIVVRPFFCCRFYGTAFLTIQPFNSIKKEVILAVIGVYCAPPNDFSVARNLLHCFVAFWNFIVLYQEKMGKTVFGISEAFWGISVVTNLLLRFCATTNSRFTTNPKCLVWKKTTSLNYKNILCIKHKTMFAFDK